MTILQHIRKLMGFLLLLPVYLSAVSEPSHPFKYDLHLSHFPGKSSKVMVCFHGMGGNYQIAQFIEEYAGIDETLISFNFPDYGRFNIAFNLAKTTFGTIQELLPAIYVLKKAIIDEGHQEVNLYGFSAGGGAIINTLAVLNSSTYDPQLKEIGVSQKDKDKILNVIQQGIIILDTPLKSIAEIVAFRKGMKDLEVVGQRYRDNDMEPIDALEKLKNLSLHVIVHFQQHDEILSNRDDDLFIERLRKSNLHGTTHVVPEKGVGHYLPHPSVWKFYLQHNHAVPTQF